MLTGHAGGVITVNIAEADDAEREAATAMHEPYRTLLGHMRHGAVITTGSPDPNVRAGRVQGLSERTRRLRRGLRATTAGRSGRLAADCQRTRAHPWRTGRKRGRTICICWTRSRQPRRAASLKPRRRDEPVLPGVRIHVVGTSRVRPADHSWFPLTVLNNLNRGPGLPMHSFVLSPSAVAKLRFVDDVVGRAKADGRSLASGRLPMKRRSSGLMRSGVQPFRSHSFGEAFQLVGGSVAHRIESECRRISSVLPP